MTGARLHLGGAPVAEPVARLDKPGMVILHLTASVPGAFVSITSAEAADALAAAATEAGRLLRGPQIMPVT